MKLRAKAQAEEQRRATSAAPSSQRANLASDELVEAPEAAESTLAVE